MTAIHPDAPRTHIGDFTRRPGAAHAEASPSSATATTASTSAAQTTLTIPPSLLLRADQVIDP